MSYSVVLRVKIVVCAVNSSFSETKVWLLVALLLLCSVSHVAVIVL